MAEWKPVPISSRGRIAGYFVSARQYDSFIARQRSFATADLPEEKIHAIAAARMDNRHEQLNALLKSK
jgi:hypothetical protein